MRQQIICFRHSNDISSLKLTAANQDKKLTANQVRITVKFSPINPSDINMIEGKYFHQPDLPFVTGKEGVGIVSEIGSIVSNVLIGDHVIIPFESNSLWHGWHQSEIVTDSKFVLKVPKTIPLEQASMLTINPLTAWLMLKKINPQSNDYIIQNAANSAVGQYVNQFASIFGIRVINVVRNEDSKKILKTLNYNNVYTDSDLQNKISEIKQKKIRFALNCVGGESARNLIKTLDENGVLLTYGAMSKNPYKYRTRP